MFKYLLHQEVIQMLQRNQPANLVKPLGVKVVVSLLLLYLLVVKPTQDLHRLLIQEALHLLQI